MSTKPDKMLLTMSELITETYARQQRRALEMQRRLEELYARFDNFDEEMSGINALDYKQDKKNMKKN